MPRSLSSNTSERLRAIAFTHPNFADERVEDVCELPVSGLGASSPSCRKGDVRLMSRTSSSRTNSRPRFGDALASCVPLLCASSRASDTALASFRGCRERDMRSGDDVRVVGTEPM